MAKKYRNPRVIIAFKPPQYDLLKRLSELEAKPMSGVVRDLFEQVEPMLREMVVALEEARAAQGKPAARLIAAMSRLQSTMQEATAQAVNQADMLSGATARQIAKLKRGATRSVKAPEKRKRAKAK